MIHIRNALAEQADKYHIENYGRTIEQLQKLCGCEQEAAIRTVVKNLTMRKDFWTAKYICDYYIRQIKEENLHRALQVLKREIGNVEISDYILNVIKNEQNLEKDTECILFIERETKLGNGKMESISLGKRHDGKSNITLADVWSEEKQK